MNVIGSGPTVINGETYTVDGQTRIVPYAPDNADRRMDLAVRLLGDRIPLNEPFVTVVGSMDDSARSLHVHLWGELRPKDSAWGAIRQVIGVPEEVADAVRQWRATQPRNAVLVFSFIRRTTSTASLVG